MRYLFDIVHPAHVHFYKHMVRSLAAAGHETRIVAREKEVTTQLLDHEDLPYLSIGRAGQKGMLRQAAELIQRDLALVKATREFGPDVILTRNPSGAQVGRLTRTTAIFDTDDGRAVGVHFRAAAPFAHIITTPDCLPEDYGAKHARYPSYKALAYLHPDRFTPDPSIHELLTIERGEPYFIVRFVAMTASHDRSEAGLDARTKRAVVDLLRSRGKVFISSEDALPPDLEPHRFQVPAHRLHDALAFAKLCVGDSGTLPAEAAMLGVPSIRCSTFAGKLSYLNELQDRYGLTFGYSPTETRAFMEKVDELSGSDQSARWQGLRKAMLADKCDLTTWYLDFLGELDRGFGKRHASGPTPRA